MQENCEFFWKTFVKQVSDGGNAAPIARVLAGAPFGPGLAVSPQRHL
jgi:hypothetical protein